MAPRVDSLPTRRLKEKDFCQRLPGSGGYAPKIDDLVLVQCDRQLFEKLKALDGNELADRTKHCPDKD